MLNKSRVKVYARLVESGIRTMEEVDEKYKVAVYVELIRKKIYSISDVDEAYIEQVQEELKLELNKE